MLVMVVFFIAFRWIHLSTPLIRLFLLVLILLLMPTLNFLPVWFALSLLRFRLPSRLRSEERFSRNAETDLVCRLLLEKKKGIRHFGAGRDNAFLMCIAGGHYERRQHRPFFQLGQDAGMAQSFA